ncbi:UDP-N-acetylmuramate--L-alanine ligase [Sediminitomix flava]|uniref:UDP-N-acetylmuramate--L-alanine ligase n=1 Tax=Sediminitomix flava TaxID=379075 RepID=A0A315ZCC7_SEDFL|nr:UDP-N-acetylmuramate--L-alanine ligase [Sediminitomix flava]PWJ42394.1 UDP-N-acetylmuramate--L-alanine ligase [Sediminitomix flava]
MDFQNVDLKQIENVFFVGIGGIGMSALARWFNLHGKNVCGYDKTQTPLTDSLEAEGISIHFTDELSNIDQVFNDKPESCLAIFTPAIPNDHSELNFFKDSRIPLLKRSEVLGLISRSLATIGVAGTHGKTTTSSMLAHILHHAGENMTAFLGGIATNYNSNLILPSANEEQSTVVVEADEYDRSFLRLSPKMEIITSVEADHLDIYGSEAYLIDSFQMYIDKLEEGDQLIVHEKVGLRSKVDGVIHQSYGEATSNDFVIKNIRIEEGQYIFDLQYGKTVIEDITMLIPGYHNVLNATAATIAALNQGLSATQIKEGLASFKGVKRRFEYWLKTDQHIYIDDYAHHPTEVEAFLSSVKNMYPKKELVAIFQPHLFSRTRDFAEEFSKSLSIADRLLLLDIYPARELPIEGVTSEMLLKNITSKKALVSKEEALKIVEEEKPKLVVTIGAGDIDRLCPEIQKILS